MDSLLASLDENEIKKVDINMYFNLIVFNG